jgi:putative endonuclease
MKDGYYYVYILKCRDGRYYTGITNDLERRVAEHQAGRNPNSYTASRLPVELVFNEFFNDVNQAIAFEKTIKKWSRKKKEALINKGYGNLPNLARKRFHKHVD